MKLSAFAFLFLTAILFSFSVAPSDMPKEKVQKKIQKWFDKHPESYELTLTNNNVSAETGRYHPERPEEKNHLIYVHYHDMEITLAFSKPFEDFEWNKENLTKYFSYVSIYKIYHTVKTPGWDIYPRTAQSSNRTGVVFSSVTQNSIAFTMDWCIFSFMGYRTTENCQKALGIEDSSAPEECYVSIRKKLPLHIEVASEITLN